MTDAKRELAEETWNLTKEQRAELDRRVAQYEQNPSDVVPWEQVRAELFGKA